MVRGQYKPELSTRKFITDWLFLLIKLLFVPLPLDSCHSVTCKITIRRKAKL